MRRSIVLQFLAGPEVVLPDDLLRRLGEAMPATESGQGLVGKYRPLAVSSSWTRTRFPLQLGNNSRICCR